MTEKFGVIALVGAPNSGKSTLSNTLLGQKVTITSPKVQTTRNVIKAILVEDETQLVILDTPGVFLPRSDKILERVIVKSAWQGIRSADFVCLMLDAQQGLNEENLRILNDLKKDGFTPAAIINKVDLVKKQKLLVITAELIENGIDDIFMISALENDGVKELKEFLLNKCQAGHWQYDEDDITDTPIKSMATEITREKLFIHLDQELPYCITVKNDSFEIKNGLLIIHQSILVTKENQKGIVLGKKGSLLKQVGSEARKDISKISGMKTSLYLHVKVKKDWMSHVENYEITDIEKIPNSKIPKKKGK